MVTTRHAYLNFICHHLSLGFVVKLVVQKKRKQWDEKREEVKDETNKLMKAEFIWEVRYPTWLSNPIMVKNQIGKLRKCLDYTDPNKASPKDSYYLLNIDRLVDGASGYQLLSFMVAYSGYNQIRVRPVDEEKTTFMTHRFNFY